MDPYSPIPAVSLTPSVKQARPKFTTPTVATLPKQPQVKAVPTVSRATLPRQTVPSLSQSLVTPRLPRTGTVTAPRVSLKFSPSGAATLPSRSSGSGTGSGSDAGTGGTTSPAWMSYTYVSNILGMVGWTGPSNYYPGVSYTVGTTTLDGATAPVISVAKSGTTTAQVLPTSSDWINTASLVIAAKQAVDTGGASAGSGGASAGGASAGGGGGGGGGFTVTSTPTGSEGSVWTDSSASYPTGEASTLEEQAQATVDAAATPTELVTEGAMTVSTDVAAAGSEGFFSKYKWWIAGGSVGAAGVYAYLHRTNPAKYPLPEMLSKWVRA